MLGLKYKTPDDASTQRAPEKDVGYGEPVSSEVRSITVEYGADMSV